MDNPKLLKTQRQLFRKSVAYSLIVSLYATSSPQALAALTDLADAPLATSTTSVVKPNILFTLDDSGSMDRTHLPDEISSWTGFVGYKNHFCNLIYYNPDIRYVPPKNADGTNFADQSLTAARSDGFNSASSPVNLSTSFKAHGADTSQPAYYYKLKTGQAAIATPPADSRCREGSSSSFPHSSTSFDKVQVTATSGPGGSDEQTNFANWYSYYRTRMNLMKTATGRAFVSLGNSYRVGFITINPNDPVTSDKYLAIADFDATHKANWFTKLYSQGTNGSTPLREALSRAGRHFAGKQDRINNGMTGDPVQYSCQQNFTLLTTDGYWNGNAGVQLDGILAIGNQDGDPAALTTTAQAPAQDFPISPRPIFDGSVAVTTTTTDVVNQFYTTSGCSSGRTRVRATTDRTVTTVDASGNTTTTTSSSTTTVVSCTRTPPALQDPNPQTTTNTTTSTSGGSSASLADVAQYYYVTDLRGPGSIGALNTDVGTRNNVPKAGSGPEDDKAPHQHMTTFTMGLGLAGTLVYDPNYKSQVSGDFNDLRTGARNWSVPSENDPTALDDLWHAAVNGRGQFFSASNPDSVVQSLTTALAGVNARIASAAAAATSNLEPIDGDNFVYTAKYRTQVWTGDLETKEIDLQTGRVGEAVEPSAQAKLNAKTGNFCDNRTIKLFRAGATDNFVDFAWNTSACDAGRNPTGSPVTTLDTSEQAFFDSTEIALLSHYASMSDGTAGTVDQRTLAAGSPLVNFLRGQRGNEGFTTNDNAAFFRAREAILGDIVNAQPIYVKAPFASYSETLNPGYAAFKSAQAGRTPMVYVGSNDGMLHAFYAGTSISDPLRVEERWAFIPTMVLPNLFRLADNNYASLHQYYVDGTPTAGDVFDPNASPSGAWKTILVGGLNRGGKGYYALDVTDPANPKGLWEFKHGSSCHPVSLTSDCHLGYTYGNPVISKLADGRWVVFVTSGYNNVNSPSIAGDGVGYLYVLNAITGEIIYKISNGTGDATTPSGLGKINSFVTDTRLDNTTVRVYGVDLLGNIWRFEVNATLPALPSAFLVGTAKDGSNNPQSITTKPFLAEFGSPPSPFVFVATGRYLGGSDLSLTQRQSVYAVKDPLTATPVSNLRTAGRTMTIAQSGNVRTISCTANCSSTDGWFVDLPDTGERVNVDIRLDLGTLAVASNVPTSSACEPSGFSWLNFFSSQTGDAVPGAANLGTRLADSLAVGLNVVRLPDGRVVVIATTSDAQQETREAPIAAGSPQGKRVSWREIVE